MKKVIYIFCLLPVVLLIAQNESNTLMYIQGADELKGSDKVKGQEYVTVYDEESHSYRYFDQLGNEIFLIKSFNEHGDQINLSIEKNPKTHVMEIIVSNQPIGFLLNSIIYDLNNEEIGRFYRGSYSKQHIDNFWSGVNFQRGNISIYDHTCLYKVGSFMFNQEKKVNHYAVLGIDKFEDLDKIDDRARKKHIRNLQRLYKKLIRKYDLRKNPNDEDLKLKVNQITNAYVKVMSDLGIEEGGEDDLFLGIFPKDFFNPEKRSKWSSEEGYVPYTKRDITEYQPDSQIQMTEKYNLQD